RLVIPSVVPCPTRNGPLVMTCVRWVAGSWLTLDEHTQWMDGGVVAVFQHCGCQRVSGPTARLKLPYLIGTSNPRKPPLPRRASSRDRIYYLYRNLRIQSNTLPSKLV